MPTRNQRQMNDDNELLVNTVVPKNKMYSFIDALIERVSHKSDL